VSIITLGHVHSDDLVPLTHHFTHLEQLVLDVRGDADVAHHRAEFNRAVDAGTAEWILIVREHEKIDEPLAKEIAEACAAAKARGFRIRAVPFYAGAPLLLDEKKGGEVRLFHKRNYIRYANKGEWDEISIQGTIVRLQNEFRSVTFATPEEHREHLKGIAASRGRIQQLATFASYVISAGTLDRNTLRYLWIEAGFRPASGD
jgi:hypothetical protein